jgi:hypothetical protein
MKTFDLVRVIKTGQNAVVEKGSVVLNSLIQKITAKQLGMNKAN